MSYPGGDGIASTGPAKNNNPKTEQLEQHTHRCPRDGVKHVGHFNGAPWPNVDTSIHHGPRGPPEISDAVARERISAFDHERIPERVVHARGAGAHGVFKLHTSLEDVTCAKVLTQTGKETPVFVRFSTVLGGSSAAETAREVRGFAAKFYTEDGNWDIVGNNIPVFFIQDGIKFPDLIHAGKPEPQIGLPQAQTAHDNMWDFLSLMPESTHMIAWMLSDHTIPRSYRMINGHGVNTFVLVNAEGKRTFVKFHWKSLQGVHSLVWDEALKLGGQDPDFLRRDLAEAIENGGYPQWELGVQLVPEEKEHDFDFDLLDCTKLIPEEQVPVKFVGTLTLNRNPTNYFAETEQVAFCTSNVVPGIDHSNDPMLQWRNFSYFDTQLSRLGGINFNSIPINRPLCPFINTIRDGYHTDVIKAGPNYHPNRFELPQVAQMNGANFATDEASIKSATKINPDFQTYSAYPVEGGMRARMRGPKFSEYISQAQLFYNSMSPVEQQHIKEAATFEVSRVDNRQIQERMMQRFAEIDYDMAVEIAEGFGIAVKKPAQANHGKKTQGQVPFSMLQPENTFPVSGRKIAVYALDGFDSTQVSAVKNAFTAAGVIVMIIGSRKGPAYPKGVSKGNDGASGVLQSNFTVESCRSTYFDALFFPDGDETYVKQLKTGRTIHHAREAYGHYKAIACAGNAVSWFCHQVVPGDTQLKADQAKTFSESVGVILAPNLTGDESSMFGKLTKGLYDAGTFGGAFSKAISNHRAWDRDVSMVAI